MQSVFQYLFEDWVNSVERGSERVNVKTSQSSDREVFVVVPSRIELESRASETLILSIVLQDHKQAPGGIYLGSKTT